MTEIGDYYMCKICGGVFEKEISDSEALKEKDELFPETLIEDCEIICDDCFKKIMPLPNTLVIELTVAIKKFEEVLKILAFRSQRLAKSLKFGQSILSRILLRFMQLGIMREKVTWLWQKLLWWHIDR